MKTRKFLKSALAVFLVMLFAIPNMTSAYAASKEFVKDLRVVYASSPEEAREKLGSEYTLVQRTYENSDGKTVKVDCSLTEGSYDSSPNNGTQNVYLAYSTTTNETEAVTDISAMFMNGDFDLTSYDSVLENFEASVSAEVEALSALVEEYRENYNEEEENGETTGKAHAAYSYLAVYYDEDYLKDNMKDKSETELAEVKDAEKYMSLADIFLDESICTQDHLTDMIVQCNSQALLLLEQHLAIAQGGEKTLLQRLSGTSYAALLKKIKASSARYRSTSAATKHIEQMYADSLDDLCVAWNDIDTYLKKYEDLSKPIEDMTEEEFKATFSDDQTKAEVVSVGTVYNKLKETEYGDSNLYDTFFCHSAEYIKENPNQYYALLSIMTEGELAALRNNYIISMILNAIPEDNDYSGAIEKVEELMDDETKIYSETVLTEDSDGNIAVKTLGQTVLAGEKPDEIELEKDEKIIDEVANQYDVEPISIYTGVDREFFKGGVALTKEAVNDIVTKGVTPLETSKEDSEDTFSKNMLFTMAGFSGAISVAFASMFIKSIVEMCTLPKTYVTYAVNNGVLSTTTTSIDTFSGAINSIKDNITKIDGYTQSNMGSISKMDLEFSQEMQIAKLDKASTLANSSSASSRIVMTSVSCFFTLVFAAGFIVCLIDAIDKAKEEEEAINNLENAAYTYPIDIPERMCWAKDTIENEDGTEATEESETTTTVTDFFFYNVVKSYQSDENKNLVEGDGDIFAKTQKEWIALYTTTDWGCGYPILADSLTIRTGSSTNPSGLEKAVRFFGQVDGFAQNLHDSKIKNLTEADDTNGLYIFYHCYQPKVGIASVFAKNMPIILCIAGGCGVCIAGAIIIAKKRKASEKA